MKTKAPPGAPYSLAIERRSDYLHVLMTGQRGTFMLTREAWGEIAERCKAERCDKVLLEKDLQKDITIIELLELISQFPSLGMSATKVAIVDRNAERSELNEFGETAAANRGMFHRVFPNVPEAEKWLRTG